MGLLFVAVLGLAVFGLLALRPDLFVRFGRVVAEFRGRPLRLDDDYAKLVRVLGIVGAAVAGFLAVVSLLNVVLQ